MNLILLFPQEIGSDGCVMLCDERARHIRKVLNADEGKRLRVGLLDGPLGSATVTRLGNEGVELHCCFEDVVPSRPPVDLILAMPRPKVMKRLWAQLAALGVGRIVLLNASKVERYYWDSHVIEEQFRTRLLIEGLQQARCTRLPEVLIRPRFKPFVEDELADLLGGSPCLLADPGAECSLRERAEGLRGKERVVLVVGPEGGWTPYEVQMLDSHGCMPFFMGERILRSDTACIALVSSLHASVFY